MTLSVSQWVSESVSEWMNGRMNEWMNERRWCLANGTMVASDEDEDEEDVPVKDV